MLSLIPALRVNSGTRPIREPDTQTPGLRGRSLRSGFRSISIRKHLEVIEVSDLLACVHSQRRSLVPLEFPLPPMCLFAIGIEHPLDVTVQRPHDADPRQHRIATTATQHQDLDRRLPFRQVEFLLRQLGDVVGCVFKGDEHPAARQRDRIFKWGGPRQFAAQNEDAPDGR